MEELRVSSIPSAKWRKFPRVGRCPGSKTAWASWQTPRGGARTWGPPLRSRRFRKTLKAEGEAAMPGRGCAGRDGGPRPGWTRAAGPRRAAGSWRLGWQAATRSDGPAQVAGVAGCRERGRGGPCVLGGKGPWKRTEPPG